MVRRRTGTWAGGAREVWLAGGARESHPAGGGRRAARGAREPCPVAAGRRKPGRWRAAQPVQAIMVGRGVQEVVILRNRSKLVAGRRGLGEIVGRMSGERKEN